MRALVARCSLTSTVESVPSAAAPASAGGAGAASSAGVGVEVAGSAGCAKAATDSDARTATPMALRLNMDDMVKKNSLNQRNAGRRAGTRFGRPRNDDFIV